MMRKKVLKTYGARGLLEWQLALRAGEATVRIHFKGGAMGSNGVTAAKYSTDSEAIQHLIEKSVHFRCGKIYVHGNPVETGEMEVRPEPASRPKARRAGDALEREEPGREAKNSVETEFEESNESECKRDSGAGCPDSGGMSAMYE